MAVTQRKGFPVWILNCKETITRSKEWINYVEELHEVVQQQLSESHVKSFGDLSYAEKMLFTDKAVLILEQRDTTKSVNLRISELLDRYINEDIAHSLLDENTVHSRTDLVLSHAEEATICLLHRWPDFKSKLKIFFNQPLPASFRQVVWKLTFPDSKIRKSYLDTLGRSPRSLISSRDLDISQKCEQILNSQPTFSTLKGSIGAFYAMKSVLSYYHSLIFKETQSGLQDHLYLIVVPFVFVQLPSLSRKDPASDKIIADIVEQFISFLNTRPSFLADVCSEINDEEFSSLMSQILSIINKYDSTLLSSVATNLKPSGDKIVTTQVGSMAYLQEVLRTIIHQMIKCLLVGYLNVDTLLYVWDQYILGHDSQRFQRELLAAIVATQILLLKPHLQKCITVSDIESSVAVESRKITSKQFQYEIKKHHFNNLWDLLVPKHKPSLPSLDPTRAEHPAWRHWYNDYVPPYTQPQDRRRARDERGAERDRLLQQQKDAEQAKRDQEERERQRAEELRLKSAAAKKQLAIDALTDVEIQLMEEKQKRLEYEKYANSEIEKLKMELQRMRAPQTPATTISSRSRMMAPPPTRASPHDVFPLGNSPNIIRTPSQQHTAIVMTDILKKVSDSLNKVANGDGADARILDEKTRIYMEQHIRDLKMAEAEVFGRELASEEYDRLSPATQKLQSEKMMKLLNTWHKQRTDNF